MEQKINKALSLRLKKLTNKELLIQGQFYKVCNRVYNNSSFQRDYNTILNELKARGLLN